MSNATAAGTFVAVSLIVILAAALKATYSDSDRGKCSGRLRE
jgi:hypothetical protein